MRMKCIVTYDGTNYNGYQIQPNVMSIQEEIETVLTKIHGGSRIQIYASGRTDKGVHAKGQVFHFDTSLKLPTQAWIKAMNAQLPSDILILDVTVVADDFHARYDAVAKQYSYWIYTAPVLDVFRRNYELHYTYPLDFIKMEEALSYFCGTYDFTSFCSARTNQLDCVRTIYRFEMQRELENRFCFVVSGNGFLYNMVRIMVGTILDIGRGRFQPNDVLSMLAGCDRTLAGMTAPAHGLYLDFVTYENDK